MFLLAFAIGLLVYIVIRIQMVNNEVTWIRRYLLRTLCSLKPDDTTKDDAVADAHVFEQPFQEDNPEPEATAVDIVPLDNEIGGAFMSTVLSVNQVQASSVQVEEIDVDTDVELEDTRGRESDDDSSVCSEGVPDMN